MNFCKHCGADIQADKKFCHNCGKNIDELNAHRSKRTWLFIKLLIAITVIILGAGALSWASSNSIIFSDIIARVSPNKPLSDRERLGLVGPVKSVKSGDDEIITFNEKGNKTSEQKLLGAMHNSWPIQKSEYKRDANGKIMQKITKRVGKNNGQLYGSEIWTFNYDSTNPTIAIDICDSDGVVTEKYTHQLDENGFDKGGTCKGFTRGGLPTANATVAYTYNKMGFLLSEKLVEADGRIRIQIENKYDEKNKLIEVNNTAIPGRQQIKYDENGNEVERANLNKDGTFSSVVAYTNYFFDNNGNWIRRGQLLAAGRQPLLNSRTIEYY